MQLSLYTYTLRVSETVRSNFRASKFPGEACSYIGLVYVPLVLYVDSVNSVQTLKVKGTGYAYYSINYLFDDVFVSEIKTHHQTFA